jgi:glycosyltransferase involved in cell wall biosynthesis
MPSDSTLPPRGHVLMLAYGYPPENVAGAARPFRFAKYLPRFGYRVSVLTASDQSGNSACEGVHHVPDRTRLWAKALRKLFLPGEMGLSWIRPACRAAGRLASKTPVSVVFSTSPPAASHVVALWLKVRRGIRWVADFRDPLIGNPGRMHKGFPYLDRALEALIFRHAGAVIANTDAVAELWRSRHPKWNRKISVIWNGFDPEEDIHAAPIPPRSYKVLTHAGNLYPERDPGIVLSAMDRLAARGLIDAAKLRIRLVGYLADSACRSPACQALLSNDILELIPTVPPAQAARAMAEADFLLLVDLTCPGAGLQVPSKLFSYIRMGRPILAATIKNSPVDRILSQSGVPYKSIYPDDSAEETDRRLMTFLGLPATPTTCSPWFQSTFDVIAQTAMLAAILNGLNSASYDGGATEMVLQPRSASVDAAAGPPPGASSGPATGG